MITKTGRHADIDMDCHAPRVMMKYTSVGPQWTRGCSMIKASVFVPEHIFHHLSTVYVQTSCFLFSIPK